MTHKMLYFLVGTHRNIHELAAKHGPNHLNAYDWFHQKKDRVDDGFRYLCKAFEMRTINSHFLDSGSFTLWSRAKDYALEHDCAETEFYDTDEHWAYLDAYAAFIKKYRVGIDFYANVDAIGHPELTWRNQKYLEKKHKLHPVPVVHYRTDLKWLKFYIGLDYDFIALGGMVGSLDTIECRQWLDRAFTIACDSRDRKPRVKLHGFGVTNYEFIWRYPWWSVDSTVWTKRGGFGGIFVPHKRKGKFTFEVEPYVLHVSLESPKTKERGKHLMTLTDRERGIVKEWVEHIGLQFGDVDADGNVLSAGVYTCSKQRRIANILYFEEMRKALPEWPWPFKYRDTRRPLI